MRKIIKISGKVLSWSVITLFCLPVLAALLINVGAVQNFAVRKATQFVSKKLGTTVSIDRIRIRGFSNIAAEGLYIADMTGDTMLYAGRLGADISKSALFRGRISIGNAFLDNARIYLRSAEDGTINIKQVLDRLGRDTTKQKGNSHLAFRNLRISDSRFMFHTDKAGQRQSGVDFADMLFADMNIESDRLDITGGAISMDIASLSFRDKSGFTVEKLSADTLKIYDGTIKLDGTTISTPSSYIDMPVFSMGGTSWQSMGNILDSVRFDIRFRNSTMSAGTLGYFVPAAASADSVTLDGLELEFKGMINDFRTSASFTVDDSAEMAMEAAITDVTDIYSAGFDIAISKLETDGMALPDIIGRFTSSPLPENTSKIIARAGDISVTATVQGDMRHMDARISLETSAGNAFIQGTGGLPERGHTDFDGRITISGIDAGILTGNETMGRLIADIKATGTVKDGKPSLDGLVFIPLVEYNGYNYTQIMATGSYNGSTAEAHLTSGDPKLALSADGSAYFGDDTPSYRLDMVLRGADLHAVNINTKDSLAMASGNLSAQVSGTGLDNLNGQVLLSDLRYMSSTDDVVADTILFTARNSDKSKYLAINSAAADAEFISNIAYKEVFSYLRHIMYDYLPALDSGGHQSALHAMQTEHAAVPDNEPEADSLQQSSRAELHFNVKEANNIAAIFLPGFSIAEGSRADAVFDTTTETFSITADSDFVEYAGFFVTKLGFVADNSSDASAVTMSLTTEDLYLPGFSMPSNNIRAIISDDTINLNAAISDSSSDLNASLAIESLLSRPAEDGKLRIEMKVSPSSYITTGSQKWNISSDMLRYGPKGISIDNFAITSGQQSLHVAGKISSERTDTVRLTLDDFSLSPLNNIAGLPQGTITGQLDGKAEMISALNDPVMIADIIMDGIGLNGYTAPPLRLTSAWDFAMERAGLFLTDMTDGRNLARGFYRPDTKTYFATIDIEGLQLEALQPLLPETVLKSLGGEMAVFMEVRSDEGKPKLNGTISATDFSAGIGITNVTYSTPTLDIDVDGRQINIPETRLADDEGNAAILHGTADISDLSDINYLVRLVPENILAINTTADDNEQFYGKIYASGAIGVRGSRQAISIDAAITTQPNSSIYVPLSSKSNINTVEWLVFAEKQQRHDTGTVLEQKKRHYERALAQRGRRREKIDMTLNVSLNITPGLLMSIIIDPSINMVLNARGSAALDLLLNPGAGDLSVFGTYEIANGDFLFSLQPIISNKLFTLQPGGTIQLSGDPMSATLDIEAIYKLRASLQPIAASLEGTGINTGTRIPVECIASISNSLSHPDLSFDIRIPSADADIQSVLRGAMATNEDRALNFMFLVGMGTFAPNSNSDSGDDASSTGASLGINLLTSQLNNMLSSDNLNINLNYKPQGKTTSEEVDFGFTYNIGGNDRLILEVDGNYNADNTMDNNNTNLSGDASLTWVITPSGNISLKGFTRTINRYDENRGLQENGIGIYYKEDFNVFSDIGKQYKARRDARRKKRAEKAAARQTAATRTAVADSSGDNPVSETSYGETPAAETDEQTSSKSRIELRKEASEERRRRMQEEIARRAESEQDTADDNSL